MLMGGISTYAAGMAILPKAGAFSIFQFSQEEVWRTGADGTAAAPAAGSSIDKDTALGERAGGRTDGHNRKDDSGC